MEIPSSFYNCEDIQSPVKPQNTVARSRNWRKASRGRRFGRASARWCSASQTDTPCVISSHQPREVIILHLSRVIRNYTTQPALEISIEWEVNVEGNMKLKKFA